MFPEMLIKDKKFLYNLINQLNVFSGITIKIRATEPVIWPFAIGYVLKCLPKYMFMKLM